MTSRGPTVSATEFARLSGVDRERLRTWERRHGFPSPVRAGKGSRRYAIADLGAVVAVRRNVESGMPVAEAVAAAHRDGEVLAAPGGETLVALAEAAPAPALILTGPRPVRVAYLNVAARGVAGAPAPGTELGEDIAPSGLAEAFTAARPRRAERPGWSGAPAVPVLLVPLPAAPGGPAAVAGDDGAPRGEREARDALERLERGHHATVAASDRRAHLLETCSLVADRLRRLSGVEALVASTELLVRRLDALDSALAPYMAGQLVLGRSTRGMLGPEMVTVAAHPELGRAITEGEVGWLGAQAAAALGAPDGVDVLVAPVISAGEPLAILVLLFEAQFELEEDLCRALAIVSAALGFALHQEQLLDAAGARRAPAN